MEIFFSLPETEELKIMLQKLNQVTSIAVIYRIAVLG